MEDIRAELFRKLKEKNCFWSYDLSKMDDISDEALIEYVLLHLDIDDIAPQGERYRALNVF